MPVKPKQADYYIDNDRETNYAPYGYNDYGTPFRADGSPINYAGDGESYLSHGGSQSGFDPSGKADGRDNVYHGSFDDDKGTSSGASSGGGAGGGSGKGDALENAYSTKAGYAKADFNKRKEDLAREAKYDAREIYLKSRQDQARVDDFVASKGFNGGGEERRRQMIEEAYDKAVEKIKREQAKSLADAQYKKDREIDKYYDSFLNAMEKL